MQRKHGSTELLALLKSPGAFVCLGTLCSVGGSQSSHQCQRPSTTVTSPNRGDNRKAVNPLPGLISITLMSREKDMNWQRISSRIGKSCNGAIERSRQRKFDRHRSLPEIATAGALATSLRTVVRVVELMRGSPQEIVHNSKRLLYSAGTSPKARAILGVPA